VSFPASSGLAAASFAFSLFIVHAQAPHGEPARRRSVVDKESR
jgi:hypothetical protein